MYLFHNMRISESSVDVTDIHLEIDGHLLDRLTRRHYVVNDLALLRGESFVGIDTLRDQLLAQDRLTSGRLSTALIAHFVPMSCQVASLHLQPLQTHSLWITVYNSHSLNSLRTSKPLISSKLIDHALDNAHTPVAHPDSGSPMGLYVRTGWLLVSSHSLTTSFYIRHRLKSR